MEPKIYLAGPQIFLPDAAERAEQERVLCRKYGFVPLHPMDNNVGVRGSDTRTAVSIRRADIIQIRQCHIIAANCNAFRGVCMDDGTAYELGIANGLGKPSYGYVKKLELLAQRTIRDYPCEPFKNGVCIDKDGYLVTDDFGTNINLMMECGMWEQGGVLVEGDLEACLVRVRFDIDAGFLKLV